MRRLVIAIDCDDVVVPTTPFFIAAYNKQYGTDVKFEQAHIEGDDIWGVPHSVMLDRFAEMIESEAYRQLGPSAEEAAILTELSTQHELHLVTARKDSQRLVTQELLELQLPGVFSSMEFVGWTGSKGEVCQRIHADVLIDDNARHLHNAIEQGLPRGGAILFGDYPWNATDASHDDLTQCADWPAVKATINELATQEKA